ncbi:unnamed protein product [Caenorhabditis auriculariae]|uniref:Uncharacterized protein n=1 Tax=Caenorhabditis auriculariae TaxID=2777116 RepID=A0A8S1HYB0_9PELO|nr:unnamed protein product [Caenorhabditis auriculariae]
MEKLVLALLCCWVAVCLAYDRLELQDRMAMSRFHDAPKAGNPQDLYLNYLSEFFGRPSGVEGQQRRFRPL